MKYQVWVKAHDPKTLAVVAETLGFEHEDRLEAERYNEALQPAAVAAYLFGDYVLAQKPLYRAETRIPGWGGLAGNPGADISTSGAGGHGYGGAGGHGGAGGGRSV